MINVFLSCTVLLAGFAFGQQRNTISIVDAETKKPLARVHVSFSSMNTITNELGQCVIPARTPVADSATISCIGYKTMKVAYRDIKPVILLEPDIKILNEVVVFPFNEADTIDKAKSLIPFNHNQYGDNIGVYKDFHFENDTLRRMARVNIRYHTDKRSKTEIVLQEAFKMEDSLHHIHTLATPYEMVPDNLEKAWFLDTRYYRYRYNGTLKDNQVYELEFQAKNPDWIKTKAPFVGKVYLTVGTLGIAKIEGSYHKSHLEDHILHYKHNKGGEVNVKTYYSGAILDFIKRDEKMVLLSRTDLIIDDRTYTINNVTDRYVSYRQLFVEDVKERTRFKKKDVLDKRKAIYSLPDSDYNIHKAEDLPIVPLPKYETDQNIKLFLNSLQEIVRLKK